MKRTKRRRFAPTVLSLESRQLLSTVYFEGANSVASFSSEGTTDRRTKTTATDIDSVGGVFDLTVSPHAGDFAGLAPQVKEVDYTVPNTLSKAGTSYSPTAASFTPQTSPVVYNKGPYLGVPGFSGYFNNVAGTNVIKVDVKFAPFGGHAVADDIYTIAAQVVAPTGGIQVKIPSETAVGTGFQLRNWQTSSLVNGQLSRTLIPTPWGSIVQERSVTFNAGSGGQSYGPQYGFGFGSPDFRGDNSQAVRASATATNWTALPGTFSIMTVSQQNMNATAKSPRSIWSGGGYRDGIWAVGRGDWGRYDTPGQTNVPVPAKASNYPPSEPPEVPLNPQYYNPSFVFPANGDTTTYLTSMQFRGTYETDLVWTPEGGVPIVISKITWSANGSAKNQRAIDKPSWTASFATQVGWVMGNPAVPTLKIESQAQNQPALLKNYHYVARDYAEGTAAKLYLDAPVWYWSR
jgi:hypothetical protein